jgi:hypothetical protein
VEEGQAADEAARSAAYPAEGWRLHIGALWHHGSELRPPRCYGADPVCRGAISQRTLYVHERRGGMLSFKGETGAAWPCTRLQHNIMVSELSSNEGVWGHEAARQDGSTAIPTNNRIVAPHLGNLDLGTPNTKTRLRRGETEGDAAVYGSLQGDGAARGRCKAILHRRLRRRMSDCKILEEIFFLRYSPSRRGLRSFTSIYSQIHRRWGSIENHSTTAVRDRRGGAVVLDSTWLTAVVRVRVWIILRMG